MPYFDAASTAPLHPLARQALLSALDDGWADPARLYRDGRKARMLLDAARETIAAELGARPDEVAFTTSGTQANHLAVLGALAGNHRKGRHLVHSAVEHSSVLHAAERHEADGGAVGAVPVDRQGRVSADQFGAALRPDTALAVLQSANHEVGTVQPVAEVAELCAAAGVPLLVDAAQSAGPLPVPAGWSLLTASAHKWGGPGGVGVLAVRKGVRYRSPLPADDRESGRVPGYVNVPAVIAAAVALRAVRQQAAELNRTQHARIERLRAELPALVPDLAVLGDPEHRLPHLLTFSCLYVDGEALLSELDRAGFAVSSGSSCTSSTLTPSHVLAAMGVLTEGNIRVSLPPDCTDADVDLFLRVLPQAVATVRAQLDAPSAGTATAGRLVLDTLGRRCPIPVIELARHLTEVPVGGVIAVLSDDEAARLDIPAWCEMRGQEYLGEEAGPTGVAYLIRRLT
ncbi:cysteine desulfurase/sulfurtransferase TusA family protein [Streptacidiphilus sp. EB129]|uniref:cysteine desulfurase/sulfurtransferase TusA family protein n=1 Tax=Streptacidiphilus sp. EB129 TaxID=3156262 RepID=UPI003518BAE1